MNLARRAVLVAYLFAIALLCLWVPWRARYDAPERSYTISLGYSVLWHPPQVLKSGRDRAVYKTVDLSRLGLGIVACSAVFGIALLLLPSPQDAGRLQAR